MRLTAKAARRIAIALGLLVSVGAAAWFFVIPRVIVRAIEAKYRGRVTIQGVWVGKASAGIRGLTLAEGTDPDSPVWFEADRVSTDVSLGSILRGRFSPTIVQVRDPVVRFRVDGQGKPLTKIPLAESKKSEQTLPEVMVEGGKLLINQADRPTFELGQIRADLKNRADHATLSVRSDDPFWGRLSASGRFEPNFESGRIELRTGPGFTADPEKTARLPFIPDEVWQHVGPNGPMDVRLDVAIQKDAPEPVNVKATVKLDRTTASFATLGITTHDTTGTLSFARGVVTLADIAGKSIGGEVTAKAGTLDFRTPNPLFQIQLGLKNVDVSQAPATWGLADLGATGRLKGDIALRVRVRGQAIDLAGTTGDVSIENGSLQGIPIKSLALNVQGQGSSLQYQTKDPQTGRMMPLTASKSRLERTTLMQLAQAIPGATPPTGPAPNPAPSPARPPNFRLPRSLSTSLELEDVDIGALLGRAELMMRWKLPWKITGLISVQVEATIPIGELKDLRSYTFRGKAILHQTTVNDFDIGRLDFGVEFANGILNLTDLRGIIADHPDPGAMPTEVLPMAPVPRDGALPEGGFRGVLRAEIIPRGTIKAHFEANRLPLVELAHLAGRDDRRLRGVLSANLEASGTVETASDPSKWDAIGSVESRQILYDKAKLDELMGRFALKGGHLSIERLSAKLAGQPLDGSGEIDLAPPREFRGRLDVKGWDIAQAASLLKFDQDRFKLIGRVEANAEASGKLEPLELISSGRARIATASTLGVALGDVTASWKTEGQTLKVDRLHASPAGGSFEANATLPTRADAGPIALQATLKNLDIAPFCRLVPGRPLELDGRVEGTLRASMANLSAPIDAKLSVRSNALAIRGIAARNATIDAETREGNARYIVAAESLGGRIRIEGTSPVKIAGTVEPAANAQVRITEIGLSRFAQALGMPTGMQQLHGQTALLANVRIPLAAPDVFTRGYLQVREINWARGFPIGTLNATFSRTPKFWRVDDLKGEMFGGAVAGSLWSDEVGTEPVADAVDGIPFLNDPGADPTPTPLRTALSNPERARFDFRVDRASLARALAFDPTLAKHIQGFGTLRLRGRMSDTLTATAELDVNHAKVFGLPVSDLKIPGELTMYPTSGFGSYQTQQATARFAGGRVRGVIRGRIGTSRSFQLELPFSDVDLEALSGTTTEARRPASGRLAGKLVLNGTDPALPEKYRGRLDAELWDASLFEMPIFREIGRFLGASSNGLFERGVFKSSIQNKILQVERLALEGRLAQIHATGTISFDGALNLEVLVNTSEIISQSGQALVGVIPGLRQALGRDAEAMLRLTNYFSNRLLKLRVTGTLKNPTVSVDPAVVITEAATGFFAGVFKLPINLLR